MENMLKNVPRDFSDEINCTLCDGVLRNAHTALECGCSFCLSCVLEYYSNKKNTLCPKCKTPIGGRPLERLVPDPTI